jgi:hypothetical protein
MIKKIIIGVLLVGAFVSLTFGVVEPVFAQAGGNNPSADGAKSGNGYQAQVNICLGDGSGYGPGTCDGDCDREPPLDGSGNKYGAHQNNAGMGAGAGIANVEEWVTVSGVVDSVEPTVWTITLEDGTVKEIYGRLLSFLIEQGFTVSPDVSLVLTGYYQDDNFGLAEIEDITTGETIALRDENGCPLWAGNRRGGWSD